MELDERVITRGIVERYMEKLLSSLDVDIAVVGGGPAGLVAAHDLADRGRKVVLLERRLSIGGGMWGGGMMFNEVVVQEAGKRILDAFGIRSRPFTDGYYTADAVEAVTTLCSKALQAGTTVFNLVGVEDVMVRQDRVTGLVINWTAVEMAGLHVDPLAIRATCVVDATGHDAEVVRVIERKVDAQLRTATGKMMGERSLWADRAEQTTLEHTREVFPGVYVAGMSANATFGSYRMGPIFGGMLLSGEKVAQMISERWESDQ